MGKANIARFSKGPLENVDAGSHDFKVSMLAMSASEMTALLDPEQHPQPTQYLKQGAVS
jgi:hypothetical protein